MHQWGHPDAGLLLLYKKIEMVLHQSIAIIGATGKMGSALTKAIAGTANDLLVMGRDSHKLKKLSKSVVARAELIPIHCAKDACWEADIVILAVPANVETEVARKIKDVVTQKIVISISPDMGISLLQEELPNSKIIKAFFNNTPAELESAQINNQTKCNVKGDDKEAVQTVSQLIVSMGLNPVVESIQAAA